MQAVTYAPKKSKTAQQKTRTNPKSPEQQLAQLRSKGSQNGTAQLEAIKRTPSASNGLPEPLRSGIEQLSGLDMGHVRVHRNSDKPAQLQANAYAQGANIYLGPGQEKHLPHEAWHVVQQHKGQVRTTNHLAGKNTNTLESLEHDADRYGKRASQYTGPSLRPMARAMPNQDIIQFQINQDHELSMHEVKILTSKLAINPHPFFNITNLLTHYAKHSKEFGLLSPKKVIDGNYKALDIIVLKHQIERYKSRALSLANKRKNITEGIFTKCKTEQEEGKNNGQTGKKMQNGSKSKRRHIKFDIRNNELVVYKILQTGREIITYYRPLGLNNMKLSEASIPQDFRNDTKFSKDYKKYIKSRHTELADTYDKGLDSDTTSEILQSEMKHTINMSKIFEEKEEDNLRLQEMMLDFQDLD